MGCAGFGGLRTLRILETVDEIEVPRCRGTLGALFFVDFLSSFSDVVFNLLSEPLGVDFELPN